MLVPQFWTNISLFPFNFTAFSGPESAILGYSWGIGSAPAADNVVALGPFTGTTQVAPAAHRLCVAMGGIAPTTLAGASMPQSCLSSCAVTPLLPS